MIVVLEYRDAGTCELDALTPRYAEALLTARIIASPGEAFGPGGEGWVRLALVPTVAACRDAVAAWGAAIDRGDVPT